MRSKIEQKKVVKRFKRTHIKAHSTPVKGQCWQRTKTIPSLRASRSWKSHKLLFRNAPSSGGWQTFHSLPGLCQWKCHSISRERNDWQLTINKHQRERFSEQKSPAGIHTKRKQHEIVSTQTRGRSNVKCHHSLRSSYRRFSVLWETSIVRARTGHFSTESGPVGHAN